MKVFFFFWQHTVIQTGVQNPGVVKTSVLQLAYQCLDFSSIFYEASVRLYMWRSVCHGSQMECVSDKLLMQKVQKFDFVFLGTEKVSPHLGKCKHSCADFGFGPTSGATSSKSVHAGT